MPAPCVCEIHHRRLKIKSLETCNMEKAMLLSKCQDMVDKSVWSDFLFFFPPTTWLLYTLLSNQAWQQSRPSQYCTVCRSKKTYYLPSFLSILTPNIDMTEYSCRTVGWDRRGSEEFTVLQLDWILIMLIHNTQR